MRRICSLLLIFLSWAPGAYATVALEYSVELENPSLRNNVKAWLGEEPETNQERTRFLSTMEERVIKSLQALGYYRADIDIGIDKSVQPWQATIAVVPNEAVRLSAVSVEIEGPASENSEFAELIASEAPRVGDVLHHGEYESLKKSILRLGLSLGYFDGKMRVHAVEVDASQSSATLRLQYSSGPRYRFGQLQVDENQFDRELLAALGTFSEGDYFDLDLLQQFQARLQQTRFFSSVLVRPRLDEAVDKRIPLSVKLYPAKRHNFDVGVGYSSDTKERISLTWRSPKLNRHGHSQDTRIEYSPVNPSGRVAYNIPLSHPLNDILQFNVRLEDNEFGDIKSLQREVGVRRELRGVDAWVRSYFTRALNESWDVDKQSRENTYLLPGLTFSHKRRQGLLVDPTEGFSQLYLLEGASENLGSDINLLRSVGKFVMVRTLAPGHRLVARAELGAVFVDDNDRDKLAPSLSFFAGGAQSIRGYGYQSLGNEIDVVGDDSASKTITVGGDRLLTASIEYQYYVNESWRGALFLDGGDAFDRGEFEMHYGAGFGIHYLTPVGAIKIEIANSISEDSPDWRLHINIGAEF